MPKWRPPFRLSLCIGLALFAVAHPPPSPASAVQHTRSNAVIEVEISDFVSCPACAIELRPLVRLGTPSDPGMVTSEMARAIRTNNDNYIVYSWGSAGVNLYGPDGAYMRQVGARGDGPGEFRAVVAVRVARNGFTWIFDRAHGRASIYSPSLEFVRSISVPVVSAVAVALDDERAVVNRPVWSSAKIGLPFHIVDTNGRYDSFGSNEEVVYSGQPSARMLQPMTLSPKDRVWAAQAWDFKLQRWDLTSRSNDLTLSRVSTWYPTGAARKQASRDEPNRPLPEIFAIQEDADGLVWVLTHIADPNWRAQLGTPVTVGGEPPFEGTIQDLWDTAVEVIDPQKQIVVARSSIQESLGGFVGDGLVSAAVEKTEGDLHVQVFTLELKGYER